MTGPQSSEKNTHCVCLALVDQMILMIYSVPLIVIQVGKVISLMQNYQVSIFFTSGGPGGRPSV